MDAFIGEIRAFCFDYAPEGWLPCDGRQVSVYEYNVLFSIIQYNFGGSGNSFNLPKIAGRVIVGTGQLQTQGGSYYRLYEKGGAETVTLDYSNIPPHTHTFNGAHTTTTPAKAIVKEPTSTSCLSNVAAKLATPILGNAYSTDVTNMSELVGGTISQDIGEGLAHSNMQPYMVFNYCICFMSDYYPQRP